MPLVKTAVPKMESPAKPKTTRKSTKRVVTAKDLADLMGSLSFDGGGKTEVPEKEMRRLLAEGVELKPHQRVAVAWMGDAEKGKFAGGILADDMGMVFPSNIYSPSFPPSFPPPLIPFASHTFSSLSRSFAPV